MGGRGRSEDWARSKVDSIPKRGKGTKNSVDNFSSPAVKPASVERIVYSERMPALPSVSPSPLIQHFAASNATRSYRHTDIMRCAFSLRVGPLAGPSCSKRRTIQPNSKRQQKNTTIPLMRLGSGVIYCALVPDYSRHNLEEKGQTRIRLQRVSHRLLNEAAVNFLSVPPGVIPDMWSATTNPQIMNFDTGYQQLSILFYILLVPFTALARSFAAGATVVLCSKQQSRDEEPAEKSSTGPTERPSAASRLVPGSSSPEAAGLRAAKIGWFGKIKCAFSDVWKTGGQLRLIWLQIWVVELLVSVRVMPLEALSYLVITLYWTLPRILDLQLAVVSSIKERLSGKAALHRSRQLARDVRWSMLALLLGTLLVARLVEIVQAQVLLRLPPRIFVDIPEIPVLVTFLAYLGNRIVNRIRDILPLATYLLQLPQHPVDRDQSTEQHKSEAGKAAQ
eukprot:jgi/Tetstr1/426738/TSEL_001675.t1